MTTLLDAPAPTRKERTMLKRKTAATAEPDTDSAIVLPAAGEQEPTVVVTDNTDPEQAAEVVTDTGVEAAADPDPDVILEPSTPETDDDDDVFAETKPRTSALPMVAFKPLQKDMSDDDDAVPYAPPMTTNPFFETDEDEWRSIGVDVDFSVPIKRESLAELEDRLADEVEKRATLAPLREAEEKAAKAKAAKDEAEAEANAKKRGSRRMLGIIMMVAGAVGVIYGAIVPFIPGM